MPHPPATRPSLLARLTDPANRGAWEEFLAVYGPLVFSDLRRRGFSHADTEDLTQQVFTRVFQGLQDFDYRPERGRFRDWLGTILRHEAIRAFRTRSRKSVAALAPGDLDAITGDAEPEWVDAFQSHIYNVALARCRPHFEATTWTAFEQVWVNGRSAAEVSLSTGLSVASVYMSKSRVLSALSETILDLTDDIPFFATVP